MARYLAVKYAEVRPDVVIALGSESIQIHRLQSFNDRTGRAMVHAGITSAEAV